MEKESTRSFSNRWTKLFTKIILHCFANFCATVLTLGVFLRGDLDQSVIQDLSGWRCIKGTANSTLATDSLVLLTHHDPDRSRITDPDPDHPKGMYPYTPYSKMAAINQYFFGLLANQPLYPCSRNCKHDATRAYLQASSLEKYFPVLSQPTIYMYILHVVFRKQKKDCKVPKIILVLLLGFCSLKTEIAIYYQSLNDICI